MDIFILRHQRILLKATSKDERDKLAKVMEDANDQGVSFRAFGNFYDGTARSSDFDLGQNKKCELDQLDFELTQRDSSQPVIPDFRSSASSYSSSTKSIAD